MSDIKGINSNAAAHNFNKNNTMNITGKGKKHAVPNENMGNPAFQVNKLFVEIHLSIKIESNERFGTQAGIKSFLDSGGIDLSQLMYNGKPITELSQSEAKALISDNGYFGVENTAMRIFNFAAAQAGDDLEKLQVARDAVLKGFKEAEDLFGGTLPDISYQTIDKGLELIDEKIRELGGSVVDVNA
jgi:hypothetical protein